MRYWDHDYGWGWFGVVMMIVTMVLFWGGLGTIVYLVVRRLGHGGRNGADRTADQILDERFARGEIDEDELKARRAALRRDAK
jgi:putative membrane protein